MVSKLNKKIAAEILRSAADEVEAYGDCPSNSKTKNTIYDIFQAMKLIDEMSK